MGGVDVLVNSTVSAYPFPTLFHLIDPKDIQGMVLTQVMSHFLLARIVMDGMRARENGVIINIASDAGKAATPGETIIGGLMAGIIMFCRTSRHRGQARRASAVNVHDAVDHRRHGDATAR